MKYFGYAECYYCKNQDGPWILENQKFICENCYKLKKETKNVILKQNTIKINKGEKNENNDRN